LGSKWQIAEQLNASETHLPLVVLFLFMLLEIGPCYDSLKGVSRIVCWVAAFLGMVATFPFLFMDRLPMWWLVLITLPMILVRERYSWISVRFLASLK